MTNSVSKDAFVAALNLSAAQVRQIQWLLELQHFHLLLVERLILQTQANYGKVRFAISVDGGATTQIDLRDKLISTSGLIHTSVLKHRL